MFGINDNDSQKPGESNGSAADAPAPTPDNPFGDSPVSDLPGPKETMSAAPSAPALDDTATVSSAAPDKPAPDDNLLDLKHQALKSLQPLVSHLDQSPEEKFKTTMMLIQATDNSSLVGQAYEAANQISDEKARAQALLDVVNEINYFTQENNKQ